MGPPWWLWKQRGDNGASECDTWLVLEGNHLQTRLPYIPVRFVVSGASVKWDDPSKNSPEAPVLLEMLSEPAGKRLVVLGTAFHDPYYPLVEFDRAVGAIDEATRLALEARLEEVLPVGVGEKTGPRL